MPLPVCLRNMVMLHRRRARNGASLVLLCREMLATADGLAAKTGVVSRLAVLLIRKRRWQDALEHLVLAAAIAVDQRNDGEVLRSRASLERFCRAHWRQVTLPDQVPLVIPPLSQALVRCEAIWEAEASTASE